MVLVSTMLVVVKSAAATYPALQLVFVRAAVGLVLVAPLIWRERAALLATRHRGRHLVRVIWNTLALTCSFAAIAALPLALVTAIGFTRPLVFLALAALLLGEPVGRTRWAATAAGLVGVLIATRPGAAPFEPALLAALGAVLFGSLAVVEVRRLREEGPVVLMAFYTVALVLLTAPPAALAWVPVAPADWPTLVAVGVIAQVGQYCFLRAHRHGEARLLAPLGYLQLPIAALAGWLAFAEVPRASTWAGAAVIVAAGIAVHLVERRQQR